MRPSTWKRVKTLYADACELPAPQRESFIQSRAAMDPLAANEALRLLRAGDLPATPLEPIRVLPPTRLRPGQTLAERYVVRRFVAAGGFGEVYEAEDRERAERIALKIFRAEFASPDHVAWLRREVDLARRVRHPNVCRVYEVVADGGLVFLTMEFLEGETLAAYLRREGALTERRALPLVRQMVAALAAAHEQGVIHRDFKPGNVMIVPRPDGPPRAVITDFGMARTSQDQRRTTVSMQSSAAFGTPAYMAPEQVSGEPAGPSADIYSLGVVLHELVTGELPFSDESPLAMAVRKTRERPASPRRYATALRPGWERTILRCLDPKPMRRFRDVREVATHLEARSPWTLRARLAQRLLKRRPWQAAAAILALLGGLLAWQGLPLPASAQTTVAWETGLLGWQGGEPLAAIQHWETLRGERLPARAPADLALAWHALGFPRRAETELGHFQPWRASSADREYAAAVRAWLAGDRRRARALLATRAAAAPRDALLRADAAALAENPHDPAAWTAVIALRPDHPGAHLRLAEAAALTGDWDEAEREYLTAGTYFQAKGQTALVKAVSARRGLRHLAGGDPAEARAHLLPGAAVAQGGTGPCERYVVLQAGLRDSYKAADDPVPFVSPRFRHHALFRNGFPKFGFNRGMNDGPYLAVSFPLPPLRFCSGRLEARMRRNPLNTGSRNDSLSLGAAPFDSPLAPPIFNNLWAEYPGGDDIEFTIDLKPEFLANVQRIYAGEPTAYLDFLAGDDTDFDYLELTLVY